jgi:hypothetical protein
MQSDDVGIAAMSNCKVAWEILTALWKFTNSINNKYNDIRNKSFTDNSSCKMTTVVLCGRSISGCVNARLESMNVFDWTKIHEQSWLLLIDMRKCSLYLRSTAHLNSLKFSVGYLSTIEQIVFLSAADASHRFPIIYTGDWCRWFGLHYKTSSSASHYEIPESWI